MSDDVKDFRYYAGAAERVIDTIQDDWPTIDVAATAAIAQVFATLAAGAPKPKQNDTSRHCAGRLEGPTPDLYYQCIKYAHDVNEPHEAPNGAIFRD